MAFTRKFLKALGIEEDKIEQIIDAHSETVTALKDERDKASGDASKLADVQKKLDEALEKLKAADSDNFKKKYEDTLAKYNDLETTTKAEKERNAKESKLREALKKEGYSDKGIAKIVKYSDFGNVKLDKDGNLDGAEALLKAVSDEWGDYKGENKPAENVPAQPPASNGGSKNNLASIVSGITDNLYGIDSSAKSESKE